MLILFVSSRVTAGKDLKPSGWISGLLLVNFLFCVDYALNVYAKTVYGQGAFALVTSVMLCLYALIQFFVVQYAFAVVEDNSKLGKIIKIFLNTLVVIRTIGRIVLPFLTAFVADADGLTGKLHIIDTCMEVVILLTLTFVGLHARDKFFGFEMFLFGINVALPLGSVVLEVTVGYNPMMYLVTIMSCHSYVLFHQTYIRNRYTQRRELENRQIEDRVERVKHEAVLAISRAYCAMYSVNFDDKSYSEIWARKSVHKYVGDGGNIEGFVSFMVTNLCSEQYKDELSAFLNFSTIQDRLKNEDAISLEYLTQDNTWFRVLIIVKDRDETGKVLSVLFASQEIDREKRRELETKEELQKAYVAAEKASQAKTAFLSNMSHDIRTPMNGIIGMTNMAKKYRDDPEKLDNCLEKISINSDHLLTLINDVLELARVESGKTTLVKEIFDLREISRTCVTVISSFISNREIELVEEHAPIDNPYVYTDSLRMRQAILNVMSNAVKYTPDGGKITLNFDSDVSPDGKIINARVTVADSGIGMSEEFLKTIFEPFAQENDHDARTQYKGTGLGMAIVKQLMDLFGGKIDIASKQGMGTTIVLTFPLERAPMPENTGESEESIVSRTSDELPKGLRVLLVEDNEINLEIAEDMLENLGCDIVTATDGLEAVDKFKQSEEGSIKCILMDVMMPRMNGYEATKAIRALNRKDAAKVAIIAMTANAFAEDIRMSHEAGMNDHISKPIEAKRVIDAIKKCLK